MHPYVARGEGSEGTEAVWQPLRLSLQLQDGKNA